MIGNYVFDFIIWLVQHLILPILPDSVPILNYSTYVEKLDSAESVLTKIFSPLAPIIDINFVLTFLMILIWSELILYSVKGVMYIINVFRGSGA